MTFVKLFTIHLQEPECDAGGWHRYEEFAYLVAGQGPHYTDDLAFYEAGVETIQSTADDTWHYGKTTYKI